MVNSLFRNQKLYQFNPISQDRNAKLHPALISTEQIDHVLYHSQTILLSIYNYTNFACSFWKKKKPIARLQYQTRKLKFCNIKLYNAIQLFVTGSLQDDI